MRDPLSFYENAPTTSPVSIISIPTDLGSDARGLAHNPKYLYTEGLLEMLAAINAEVGEEVEIPCPAAPPPSTGTLKNLAEVAHVADAAAQAVEKAAKRGDIIVALGGDHSASIGTLRGASAAHDSLGVIWIDAHPDVHTHETTQTHNLHDMPAALAMGYGHAELLGKNRKSIQPKDFIFIALKDFAQGDQGEINFLRTHAAPYYTMLDIACHGLAPIFDAIDKLSQQVQKVWVVMDMDSIDRAYAPGVAMPNTNGLTRREVLALAQYIGKTCNVAGVDLMEMLPGNDVEGKTAGLALELIAWFLGSEHAWYRRYMAQYEESVSKPSAVAKT